MKSPKVTDPHPERAAAALAMRNLLAGLAPSAVGGKHDEVVTYATPITAAALCTGTTQIAVPLDGHRSRTIHFRLQARTSPPAGKRKRRARYRLDNSQMSRPEVMSG